jgi:uncharacterized membrane protein YfhO
MQNIWIAWKVFFVIMMFGLIIPMRAESADAVVKPIDLDISIKSDSYYNSTNENITSKTGFVVELQDFTFDITPTVTSDDTLTDMKFGFQYAWEISDNIIIAPYSELHYDDNFSEGDKVIGIKTIIKLY